MGALCCKPLTQSYNNIESSSLLVQDETPQSPLMQNTSYDELASENNQRIIKEANLLNQISSSTANDLIDISSQPIYPKDSAPDPISNSDYKQLLQYFDSRVDMSLQLPKLNLFSDFDNKTNLSDQSIFSRLFINPSLEDAKDLELIERVSSNISKTMSEFKLEYTGPIFVPFIYEE
ncbi:hypothetical protein AYI69_g5050 [Smittium culicis]|uniref:Uncharacterized protein n=1 Tax=Smittium culicis TaxID=133412 RepID=A0A1R1Y8I4_9FUNG|nr:hypothetical protein AYI69_g5050 [Smittium culicis]